MRQIAIIGLGNFGYYLGRELYNRGFEVIGLDIRKETVQKVKNEITEAVVADATDKDTLLALGIDQADLAVVTIGTNMLASILTTFQLKEIGVKRVYAKALSAEHEQILTRIGADRVLFPEKDLALSLAQRIANPNMIEYLPFIEDHSIYEVEAPEFFIGKTLKELDLINRYGIQVIAVRNLVNNQLILIPRANFTVQKEHLLILLGPDKALQELSREAEKAKSRSKRND